MSATGRAESDHPRVSARGRQAPVETRIRVLTPFRLLEQLLARDNDAAASADRNTDTFTSSVCDLLTRDDADTSVSTIETHVISDALAEKHDVVQRSADDALI